MMGEYDAGYENYIDSLIREIEKLQDENDKLSEQVSSLVGRSFRTADKMSCIEAENAKLRELAGALLTSHEKMCTQRGHCFGCTFFYEEVKACPYVKISRTLRELGVEVEA